MAGSTLPLTSKHSPKIIDGKNTAKAPTDEKYQAWAAAKIALTIILAGVI